MDVTGFWCQGIQGLGENRILTNKVYSMADFISFETNFVNVIIYIYIYIYIYISISIHSNYQVVHFWQVPFVFPVHDY